MALSSLPLPELNFLTSTRRRIAISRFYTVKSVSVGTKYSIAIRTRINAAKEEGAALVEERVNDVEWSGNGAAYGSNGYVNAGNGSLMKKYVNGNGATVADVDDDVEVSKLKEDGRKRRIEEIGKEDAWFKKSGDDKVQV